MALEVDSPVASSKHATKQIITWNMMHPVLAASRALQVLQPLRDVQQQHLIGAFLPCTATMASRLQPFSDGAAAVTGLLHSAATEQSAHTLTTMHADVNCNTRYSDMVHAAQSMADGKAGMLHAMSVHGGAALVPRLITCSTPESAAWVQVTPQPRSSFANLVTRPVAMSKVRHV